MTYSIIDNSFSHAIIMFKGVFTPYPIRILISLDLINQILITFLYLLPSLYVNTIQLNNSYYVFTSHI